MADPRCSSAGGVLKTAFAAFLMLWSSAAIAGRGEGWSADIARASARFAIPEPWIRRVMRVESGGQAVRGGTPIVSRAGAMGLMQLMPGTWRDMRAMLGLGADPYDPADNILAGAAYLKLMYDRFGYPGLFAAYNAGPSRYAAYLARGYPLPAETRAYVAAIASVKVQRSSTRPASPARLFALDAISARSLPAESPGLPAASLFVALKGTPAR